MYELNSDINNIFKALGHKTRTDLLDIIRNKKDGITLYQLAELFKTPLQTIAFHLAIMKRAKMFKSRKKSGEIYLTIDKKRMKQIEKIIKSWSG